MDDFYAFKDHGDDDPYGDLLGLRSTRDKTIQIIISLLFGLTAFLAFCILRPRWTELYAARKRQKNEAAVLPDLPDSLFGWILPLWRVTDQQILASAGLDAYAFLAFFKMAMKYLIITLFFSLIVIKPVHDAHPDDNDSDHSGKKHGDKDHGGKDHDLLIRRLSSSSFEGKLPDFLNQEVDYLWMYVIFAYLFSALAIYLLVTETKKIIEIRQEYLGTQTSITDRTIRLSGIPPDLQEEEKIKDFIESLDIGKVEKVTLCRKWKELDDAVSSRMDILRRLEEAYTQLMAYRQSEGSRLALPFTRSASRTEPGTDDGGEEEDNALAGANGGSNSRYHGEERPKIKLRHGFLNLQSNQVDAIEHYEGKLRDADERIKELRRSTFAPTPLAFVTLDSVAASQMAMQAVLDPSPQQLIANQSPAPADVVWRNTYLTRRSRMIRSWSITVLIVFLTVFWSVLLLPIAGLLNTETIGKIFPGLADLLEKHENAKSLVNTQAPTLIASLLMILVSYLYYYLSWYQGMISQGDVELSAVSKNFFFTFFNFFVVFTIFSAGAEFYRLFQQFGDALKDLQKLTFTLAVSLQGSLNFYVNFIILQGLGLFPFRLLEVGSVSLYPLYRIGAKTPRDYAELVQPPVFSYAFYLPNALLIFIICMVYSVLRSSWQVLLAGLVYFAFGHFVYKYQLLYAMDHQQQATGRAWGMMCDRVFVGLVLFQVATAGQIGFRKAVTLSALLIPLVIVTICISIVFSRTYKPLLQFIALRSVHRGERYSDYPTTPPEATSTNSNELAPERNAWAEDSSSQQIRYFRETRIGLAQQRADENGENSIGFINPSLVAPLDRLWMDNKDFRREDEAEVPNGDETA